MKRTRSFTVSSLIVFAFGVIFSACAVQPAAQPAAQAQPQPSAQASPKFNIEEFAHPNPSSRTSTVPGSLPSPYSPIDPTSASDITCRPKMKLDAKTTSKPICAVVLDESGQPKKDKWGNQVLICANVSLVNPNGDPLPPEKAEVPAISDQYCRPLLPATRLILENAAISSTFQHSNQAGLTNVAATNPSNTALIQSNDSYSVGVGYVNKPILKQARAVVENDKDGRRDVSRQGTFWEDFFWNAILANASLSYGRTITVKNGQLTDSLVTRPSFSAGVTYQLDLERAYVHLFHTDFFRLDNRPVDAGYYYAPNPDDKNFWPEPPKYNDGE